YDTPPVYPKEEPKSIDSMPPQSRTFFIRTVSRILDPSDLSRLLPTPSHTKIKEPKSIESDFPGRKVSGSLRSPLPPQGSVWSVKPQFDAMSSTTLHRLESSISRIEPTSTIELSPVILRTEVSSTWLSTAPESTDVILVSVLPVSSFLNVNQTKNGTGDRGHLDESHSTDESGAIPTRNTFLFKDNHYWILTGKGIHEKTPCDITACWREYLRTAPGSEVVVDRLGARTSLEFYPLCELSCYCRY
ncbi:hypothetical protein AVEN_228809-1, partial [Araneus ventricosus]